MSAKSSRRDGTWWLVTVAGIGCLPKAPGTWGSLAAALFAFALFSYISIYYIIFLIFFMSIIGVWASDRYVRRHGAEDPQEIVLDEVAGQFLALALAPVDWRWYLAGFALFRAFDILKPFPANWCDRHLPGGFGVMVDDLVAGFYVCILLVLAENIIGKL